MTQAGITYLVVFVVAVGAVVALAVTGVLSSTATYALVAGLIGHALGIPVTVTKTPPGP